MNDSRWWTAIAVLFVLVFAVAQNWWGAGAWLIVAIAGGWKTLHDRKRKGASRM